MLDGVWRATIAMKRERLNRLASGFTHASRSASVMGCGRNSILMTKVFARCGSMRRKMANVVEGCWYSFLKVVPGSLSRYSASDRAGLIDMLGECGEAAVR